MLMDVLSRFDLFLRFVTKRTLVAVDRVGRSYWLYLTHFLTTKLSVLVNSFCLNFLYVLSFINWYNFVNIVRTERHTA